MSSSNEFSDSTSISNTGRSSQVPSLIPNTHLIHPQHPFNPFPTLNESNPPPL